MSYITPSQRGFDAQQQEEVANNLDQTNSRVPSSLPLQSFDNFCSLPHSQSGADAADHPSSSMPKVGETRCYWSLLNADLQFLYLDPVLASHLGPQADALIGKPLLAFVHPDEQSSARHDLGSVLESRTLHGSVTRVRFSRLSKVRRQLGCTDPASLWTEGDKIALDQNYMAIDIVINWAAEGLVLCFMHAVVDLTPYDSDPRYKTGWTNWCSTPPYVMNNEQVQLMYQRLLASVPHTGSMERVFQIMLNQQGNRQCLMSWPPDQGQPVGSMAKDFARLAEEVQIGEDSGGGASDAKTSCTRRYKALQSISMGVEGLKEVESIFIPHGTIIFACHKVNGRSNQIYNGASNGYSQEQYYDQPYSVSATPQYNGYLSQPPPQQLQAQSYQGPQWSEQSSSQAYGQWSPSTPSPTQPTQPHRSVPYASQAWSSQGNTSPSPSTAIPYLDPSFQHRPATPSYPYIASQEGASPSTLSTTSSTLSTNGATAGSAGGSNVDDVVPPPRHGSRRASPNSGATRDSYGSGGRSAGHPPLGVVKCSSCKATQSPEWRKGPSGKKDLCNACGLRYARSRAKKEGISSQRRRKDRGYASASSSASTSSPTVKTEPLPAQAPLTPSSPITSYASSALRRSGYDDGPSSFGTSHAGSGHHHLNGMTPSPSPSPSTSMSFAPHYSQQHNGPSSANGNSFYSTVSPSGAMLSPHLHPNSHLSSASALALPRLDSLSSFPNSHSRLSISSPASSSPLTAPPYDRDRERAERDRGEASSGMPLPPTPVSAGMESHRHRG